MRTSGLKLRYLAVAGCAAWAALGPGAARAGDPETFRARVDPIEVPAGTPGVFRPAASPAWMPEEAVERGREHDAASVGEAYVSDHLDTWLEGTPLEVVDRLRHTDFVVSGGASGASGPGGLDVRVRLAEKVRVTIARDGFRRDLLYDPIRGRMSMDLYATTLPGLETGVALTESVGVDDGASRLLLNLHHRLE
jgi:hypothetical protein